MDIIFTTSKFLPSIVQEASEWQTIIKLVEENLGLSICPQSLQHIRIGNVQYRTLTGIKTQTKVSACVNATSSSPLIDSFMQILKVDELQRAQKIAIGQIIRKKS